jgi:hypothetical protein
MTDCPQLILEEPMATCEYILDVASYGKVPAAPTADDKARLGEAQFLLLQRGHDLAKVTRDTSHAFFLAVRWFLDKQIGFNKITAASGAPPAALDATSEGLQITDASLTPVEKARFLSVAGLLIADSQLDALNGKLKDMLSKAVGDVIDPPVYVAAPFIAAMTRSLAEFNAHSEHFLAVYDLLKARSVTARDPATGVPTDFKFRARQIGVISRALISEGADPSDSQFGVRFERALAQALPGATEGLSSTIDIDLPDLEAGTEADIIGDNVKALSAIYFAAMLEELKFFSVMDKVVEQFMNGGLPIKRSSAGDPLYRYHRDAQIRINEFERRGLYARSFGVAQGSVDEPMPNREFNDVWIRFLSAVSVYGREIKSSDRRMVSPEQVFKTARDAGVNLSLHGFGLAHFAAIELQNLIKSIKETLSNVDVLAAYGVRDIWQLVERVSNMYLGGAVNGVRQRTMAASGAAIIQWLAASAPSLIGSYRNLTVDDVLISHVERWLAVTGTPDTATEKYSEPVALQSQRTIPDFAIPSGAGAAGEAIRDALSRVNLPTTPQA